MVKVNGYSLDNPKRLPNNISTEYLDNLYATMVKNDLEIYMVWKVSDNGVNNGRYISFTKYDPDYSDGTRFIFSNFGYFPNK